MIPHAASSESSEARTDFRLTPQRRVVYEVVRERPDHPTASDVYQRVKERMPGISLATVYNCLETLTLSGLIRQVNFDRAPSRYCPNLKQHAHFHCEGCGQITDVALREGACAASILDLPAGTVVTKFDVVLRGNCPACAAAVTTPLIS